MIKSQNILKVIRNLQNVLPAAQKESNLNMNKCGVNACMTTMCHGGWYAVATMNPLRSVFSPGISFMDGANMLAKDLNLNSSCDLTVWAMNNPEIWGNTRGACMFAEANAFRSKSRPNGAQKLADIIDHWCEVYERVKKLEEPEVKYVDITKDLAVLPADEVPDTIKKYEVQPVS